mmetsp:Transcript_18191/g.30516  ORF Transcript_18191/g.30516 Transcript_18191/m.30516 type:complete len:284 (-) Transcript_18191:78-929(-)
MLLSIRSVSTSFIGAWRLNGARYLHAHIGVKQRENGVVLLSLEREKGRNSLSKDMIAEINEVTTKLAADKSVRAMIITSGVEKVFCAGADLKERLAMNVEEVDLFVRKLQQSFQHIADLPFPTIAAIEGVALGGGLELALACDIRVAGSKALLGLPETSLAIIPGAGGTQRLPRLIGPAKAKELIFTSARLTAAQGAEIGLVNWCVEAGDALVTAEEIATKIVANGPVGVRAAKKAIDHGLDESLEHGLNVEAQFYAEVVHTEDRLEGLNSFVEKRKPQYKGK